MENKKTIKVYDEKGNEKEMVVLFTTNIEKYNKQYIFYFDALDQDHRVFVSSLNEHNLEPIENDEEWKDLELAFNDYVKNSQPKCPSCNGDCGNDCDGNCDCDGDCKKE